MNKQHVCPIDGILSSEHGEHRRKLAMLDSQGYPLPPELDTARTSLQGCQAFASRLSSRLTQVFFFSRLVRCW